MPIPQSAILPDASPHAIFLTLALGPESDAAAHVRRAAARLSALAGQANQLDGQSGNEVLSAIGFGAAVWDRLYPAARPDNLTPFQVLSDNGRRAPATAGDIFIHLRGTRFDLCFETARHFRNLLGGAVTVVEETHGFRYLDSRDLTGFVDGTENPQGDEDRTRVALLSGGAGPFEAGSFVAVQRYIHDLVSWEALAIEEQEKIIGRSKAENIEFSAEEKAPTAHIKRVNLKEDGQSLEILRHSMPYGTVSEHGLLFVAYGADPTIFDKMLHEMILADRAGHYDHLMSHSRAVTGTRFFVPPQDWLRQNAENS